MNILHLLDSPDRGGTETLVLDLCRNSKSNGLNLILVVTKLGVLDEEFRSSGVNYYYIPRKYPIDLVLVFKLRKIIKNKNVKVIHAHQAVDGMHAFITRFFTNIKTVMTFHGYVSSLKNDLTLKFLIPRMDANVAVSNSFLNALREHFKFNLTRNFHVIYNGIDTKKFYKSNKDLRTELKLSDSDLLLGMVGNFNNNVRDQITVCKALPEILKKYSNMHFVFVGRRADESPQYYDECFTYCQENEILDRTHFLGLRSDINNILNSLDLFVYSSNYDTFGIAVIEAMLSEVPVVLNDLPPLLEITDGGKYAYVFKSKSFDDLINCTINAIENKEQSKSIAKTAKEWASNKFSIEEHISNLKYLYKNI